MSRSDLEVTGVLPSQWIRQAIADGILCPATPVAPGQIQPNSLDLRLGEIGYRVQCSFLPGPEGVEKKLARFKWYDLALSEAGTVLERNQVYLFPLRERLALPPSISVRANPKSTIGRLDVFTRLVTETGTAFDAVPAGYQGALYLEVVPRSFAIKVRPGDSLAQVRFQTGEPQFSDLETQAILDREEIVLGPDLLPLRSTDLRLSNGIFLSVRLHGALDATIGYRARKNTPPIDLRAIGTVPIRRYWERLYGRPSAPVILEPDEFYIFSSRELVRLPPQYCAEMVPFDASSGELRTHYAGFFDSGFGYAGGAPPAQNAAAVVLEVRNRDVPFLIEEGHPLFRLLLLKNTEPPTSLYGAEMGSNYQAQRLRLSKQFQPPEDEEILHTGHQEHLPF
ncbi:MAG TPA: 2'-deoxycytidine 5'-triphosphate deaminase [Chthonomonadaceae bacterium]|nr:2'-deoxycytidine 5'-triphosphate deaminase [Chthonomonadaceae bacterium]